MMKKIGFFALVVLLSGAAFGQTITVTSPRSGDTWRIGETHAVTWARSGAMDDEVKILLFQGGARESVIADRVPNSGSFSWTIPASVEPGRYVIRVRTIDTAVRDDSDEFTIAGPAAPSGGSSTASPVRLIKPNGGGRIIIGRPYRIMWEARSGGPAGALVDLALWRRGGRVGTLAQGIPLKASFFDWTAGRFEGGTAPAGDGYTIRIRVRGASAEDESDGSFTLAAEAGGDLELVALENDGNKVMARIRSTFPRFANTVMYEMRRPTGAPTPVYSYHLDMLFEGPGERVYTMETVIPSRPTDADWCCSTYEMTLDTTNRIEETNEGNNRRSACLYGNPTLAAVEDVTWTGTGHAQRGQVLRVRSGTVNLYSLPGIHESGEGSAPWRVVAHLNVELRNCGYHRISNGELRVSQVGELFPDEKPSALGGGFLREHRTVVLLRQPVDLLDMGREVYINTDSISFHPVSSEVIVEYLWEDEGVHSERSVFRFNIDFSSFLADY